MRRDGGDARLETQSRTMTTDLEYYRLQPYSRTFEIRTEGSERYLLYRIKEIPTRAWRSPTQTASCRSHPRLSPPLTR